MSDPQRNAIEELGLSEDEAFTMVRQAMGELDSPMTIRIMSADNELGFTYQSRTASSALRAMTDSIEENTGCSTKEAMKSAIDTLKEIRDYAKENGSEAGLKKVGSKQEIDKIIVEIRDWKLGGKKMSDAPFFTDSESKTPLNSVIDFTAGQALKKHQNAEIDAHRDLVNKAAEVNEKTFKSKLDADDAYLDVKAKNLGERVKAARQYLDLSASSSKAKNAVEQRSADMSKRIERASEAGSKKIHSKAHETRFKNFWRSEEGRERYKKVVQQGAMMSLAARRMQGMTRRETPTQLDVKAAETAFGKQLKEGKYSRESGIRAIHESANQGQIAHLKSQGKSPAEIEQAMTSAPKVHQVYKELTGKKITIKEAEKLLLRSSEQITKQFVRKEDTQLAKIVQSDLEKAHEQSQKEMLSGKLTIDTEINKGIVSAEDAKKAKVVNESFNRFEYVKTEKPLNKDLEDQNLPEKKALTEELKKDQHKARDDFKHQDRIGDRYKKRSDDLNKELNRPLDQDEEEKKRVREENYRKDRGRDRDDGPSRTR